MDSQTTILAVVAIALIFMTVTKWMEHRHAERLAKLAAPAPVVAAAPAAPVAAAPAADQPQQG